MSGFSRETLPLKGSHVVLGRISSVEIHLIWVILKGKQRHWKVLQLC